MKTYKIPFLKYHTAVYQFGELDNKHPVVIVLHGGPGGNHNLVKPFIGLNKRGFTMILYDQLGSLNSSHIKGKKELFKFQTFVDELDNLVTKLKLKKYHLIGHSWGGMLALEYILRKKPKGLDKLVLFSTLSSGKLWNDSNLKHCAQYLTTKLHKKLLMAYKQKDVQTLERIYKKYLRSHYKIKTNTSPYPRIHNRKDSGDEIYEYMWGKVDPFGVGPLQNWDITNQLNKIKVPTLILYGKYDQSTKEINDILHQKIKDSRLIFLSKSSHIGYYNEYPKVMKIITNFLKQN